VVSRASGLIGERSGVGCLFVVTTLALMLPGAVSAADGDPASDGGGGVITIQIPPPPPAPITITIPELDQKATKQPSKPSKRESTPTTASSPAPTPPPPTPAPTTRAGAARGSPPAPQRSEQAPPVARPTPTDRAGTSSRSSAATKAQLRVRGVIGGRVSGASGAMVARAVVRRAIVTPSVGIGETTVGAPLDRVPTVAVVVLLAGLALAVVTLLAAAGLAIVSTPRDRALVDTERGGTQRAQTAVLGLGLAGAIGMLVGLLITLAST
jgi:hypothetical protein